MRAITRQAWLWAAGAVAVAGCRSVPDGDEFRWGYAVTNGMVTITNYTGSGETVAIPGRINGLPVTGIGDSAFDGCASLTNVAIPKSVTSIGKHAFSGCGNLETITVHSRNRSYSAVDGVLFNRDKTTLIACPEGRTQAYPIPERVKDIGAGAFSYCANLASVTIPTGASVIGRGAFANCTSLSSITIPDSVTNIGVWAFECASLTNVTIGAGIAIISEMAFAHCTNLASVTIGTNVFMIEGSAFGGCTGLASITIPDNVNSIGNSAFAYCSSLTNVTIGNGVRTIGGYAFEGCGSLTNITIPASVNIIGDRAFEGCGSLESITVDARNRFNSAADGVLFTREQYTIILVRCPERKTGTYAIPDNVDSIGKGAFAGCNCLTGVTIPDSVTSIGGRAFEGCGSLTNITIPDSVKDIDYWAFYGCTNLASIRIPDNVTRIAEQAFDGCINLTNITVDVTNAFYSSVDGVLFNREQTQLIRCPPGRAGSYRIPAGVTNIGCWAFAHCTRLTDVAVPPSVTDVEVAAFAECTNLTTLCFQGNAPNLRADMNRGCMPPSPMIFEHADKATIYHLPGAIGWGTTFGNRPTAIWNPQTNSTTKTHSK